MLRTLAVEIAFSFFCSEELTRHLVLAENSDSITAPIAVVEYALSEALD